MTGRYEGVLVLIWRELIRSLFMDFTPELPGSGAKVYAERTPYYLEAKRLREQVAACERKLKRMMAQRQEELDALQGRNDLIARTLASWNRALGAAGKEGEIDDLREQLEILAGQLKEANAIVQALSEEAYKDPLMKILEAFETLNILC